MIKAEVATAVSDAVKGIAPTVAVNTMTVLGVALSDWVYICTLAYLGIHSGYILYKWYKGK